MESIKFYYPMFIVSYREGNRLGATRIVILALNGRYNDLPSNEVVDNVVTSCIADAYAGGVEFDNIHKFDAFLQRIYAKIKRQ